MKRQRHYTDPGHGRPLHQYYHQHHHHQHHHQENFQSKQPRVCSADPFGAQYQRQFFPPPPPPITLANPNAGAEQNWPQDWRHYTLQGSGHIQQNSIQTYYAQQPRPPASQPVSRSGAGAGVVLNGAQASRQMELAEIAEKKRLWRAEKNKKKWERKRRKREEQQQREEGEEEAKREKQPIKANDGDEIVQEARKNCGGTATNNNNGHKQDIQNGHQQKAAKPFKLPDRWSKYAIGVRHPLAGTRFLPFKCPLRTEFFKPGMADQRFDIASILEHLSSLNSAAINKEDANGKDEDNNDNAAASQPHQRSFELGLVIDLTATDRYYDHQQWADNQIIYEKLPCHGHTVHAKEYIYHRFAQCVRKFLAENATNDKLIGVHCTHGLNRTGFLICRFLVQEQGWAAQRALECFALARGYPIERGPYIETLHEIERRCHWRKGK